MHPIDLPHSLSIRQLFQWAKQPSKFLDTCAKQYGDVFTAQFPGGKPVTFVSHPQGLEQVLTAPVGTFASGEGSEKFRPIMGDHSLLVLDGKPHRRQRKLMMPPFHGARMRLYGDLICQLTEKAIAAWQVGTTFNLFACTENIALNTLLSVVFGFTESEVSSPLHQRLLALIEFTTSPLLALHLFIPALRQNLGPWSPWGKFLRLQQEVDQLLYAEIDQRRRSPQGDRTDILALLIEARDEAGEPMSSQELRDELLTLLMAGYDTVALAMMWALYRIHQVPHVRDRLLEEFSTVADPTDTKAIAKLPYLTATCQETLRMAPSILTGSIRVAQVPFELMGQEFPIGSRIYPNIYAAHRRPETYPHPHQFEPERFLDRAFTPYEFFPFGGGTRGCIGSAFAQFQMKLVLFTLLSRYQLALADAHPVQPIRRGPGLIPSKPIIMAVTANQRCPSTVALTV